ncbi:MAG: cytochrome C oxidase subunit IV family protein [Myxococcales bacterium]|nr:cytochrome C oxidase subunit IV family protein [Myxococcales bacterium]
MATTTKDDHGHGHDDGAVHAHVSSVPFYLLIFGALIFFTVLTVGQSYVDLGKLNLLFVILIASCKASLVVLFFMHLRHDNKVHGVFFVCGLLFIGVFFAYTFNDTEHRAEMEETSSVPVLPKTGEQAPGSMDEKAVLESRAKMVKEHHAGGGGGHGATPEKAPEHH